MKKISNEFFQSAILKGNSAILDDFSPSVVEQNVANDTFFTIRSDTAHKSINERITKIVFSKIPINTSACGFVSGKSYYDFLSPHVYSYYYLRLDIKQFFHSIPISEVKKLLEDNFTKDKGTFKYSPYEIAFMALTHRVSKNSSNKELINKDLLPIGFSSSPVISNILFRKIDILIQKYCENKKIKYTRYADDLLFSTLNSKFVHSEQFEKEISILVSTLGLKLNNKKRKACENTISLNGYVIQNTKPKEMTFFSVRKDDPVGTIRLSNKKLKIIKKLIAAIGKNIPSVTIMEGLFGMNFDKFREKHFNNLMFFNKYVEDQLQNKLKGYRSYLISLIQYDKRVGHVDVDCLESVIELINKINKYIK